MSTCISRKGEFSEHSLTDPDDPFCCQRCFVFDEEAAMDRIVTLAVECDMALRMHQVQFERANRLAAEHDQMAGALADMTHERNDARAERDALPERIALAIEACKETDFLDVAASRAPMAAYDKAARIARAGGAER